MRGTHLRIGIGIADMRAEPKFRSERVNQLIWGQSVEKAGGETGGYLKVRAHDGYEGYIASKCLRNARGAVRHKLVIGSRIGDIRLPVGSLLTDDDMKELSISPGKVRGTDYTTDIISLAKRYLGVPYLWGGGTEYGTDCSGLTQRVYGFNNIPLPRNADAQERAGRVVETLSEAVPADLIFFPGHVGMHIGGGSIIHANLHWQRVTIIDLGGRDAYSRMLKKSITSIRRYIA